ncbi:hypothetical protein [Thalassovita taeanensis]|uniref:Sulfotransferase family protein n=1 Tax=Thalassovita taeanensis TaxID=657014 RepID=A0A1H9DJ58_9RHOB|nr:hypothetical protein [Thalassovita taeanensis]SEQ13530.1 hypothetical protein SAMN04488092_104178 [Thalassovita taeanensis]
MRLILHAGFHKTGTSSIQNFLYQNKPTLSAEFRVLMRPKIKALCDCARGFSVNRNPLDQGLFLSEAAQALSALDPADPRPVVISAEDLSGHTPGRHRLLSYAATPALMQMLVQVADECLPGAELTFLFTTRDPESWLRSSYAQSLRATRQRLGWAAYFATLSPHADFGPVLDEIQTAVAPHHVFTAALEDSQTHPLGPATALLDLMQPSDALRAALVPVSPQNRKLPDPVLDALLHLNRSDLPKDEMRRRKADLITQALG